MSKQIVLALTIGFITAFLPASDADVVKSF